MQDCLKHFAGGVAWQGFFEDLEVVRQLVGGENLCAERPHLFQVQGFPGALHDVGLDLLAKGSVVDSADCTLGDCGMLFKSGLDLGRVNVFTTAED